MLPIENKKLSQYLDELAEEYKELLYSRFLEEADPNDELSLTTLLRIDSAIKEPLTTDYKKQKRAKTLSSLIGLVYSFLGLVFLLILYLQETQFSEKKTMVDYSLFLIAIGMVLCLTALFVSLFGKKNKEKVNKDTLKSKKYYEYEIVSLWRELEGIVNDLSKKTGQKNNHSVIDFLWGNHLISIEENKDLKKVLRARNTIVHSAENNYSINDYMQFVTMITKVNEKLKELIGLN